MYTINWCEWEDIVNPKFIPLIECQDRYIVMYGGRGSSKSNFEAKKLIYRCLTEKYFRHLLIRNTYATIKDSSYQTIKDIIFELGLGDLFEFKLQPLEIHCINGNSFLARGCDDTTKIKSVKDPTGAWWEEDIPTEEDFITVTTSIRTTKADFLQETFTINPEVEGNYQDNWFYQRFFGTHEELSFQDTVTIKYGDEDVNLRCTVHHSTCDDNQWLPIEFIAFLDELKKTNAYYWEVYRNGKWGNKQLGGRFYKNFDLGRNMLNFEYKPSFPLHISFDFNTNPYMTLSVWQIEGKVVYLIDELAMKDPNNKVKDTCREFIRRYAHHKGGLFIYGDPSGKKEDVDKEKGHNYFITIGQELKRYNPTFRISKGAPPVVPRGDFINDIFASSFDGISIFLFEKSVYLKNDLLFGKQAPGGEKLKEKEKINNIPGVEKYHHFSDSMDYFICEAFKESFNRHQKGPDEIMRRPMGLNSRNQNVRL